MEPFSAVRLMVDNPDPDFEAANMKCGKFFGDKDASTMSAERSTGEKIEKIIDMNHTI